MVSDSYECLVEMGESAFWPFLPCKRGKNRFFGDFSDVYVRNGFIFGG